MEASVPKGWLQDGLQDGRASAPDQWPGAKAIALPALCKLTQPQSQGCPIHSSGSAGLHVGPTCCGLLGSSGSRVALGAEASGRSTASSASSSSPPPRGVGPSGEVPGQGARE